MTIKLLLLKSGEDIIADVSEMVIGEEENKRVIGYFLKQPCVVKMRKPQVVDEEKAKTTAGFEVSIFPWMPLTKEKIIPITSEWVITMVNPMDKLEQMYIDDILNYEQDNQNTSTDNESESD